MASLYKKPVKIKDPKTGELVTQRSKKWWGRYRDAAGIERRVPLVSDKPSALAMLNELMKRVDRERAGLVDPFEDHQKRPLSQHLDDYAQSLRDRGTTNGHVTTTIHRCRKVVDGCRFTKVSDISPSRVQGFLADLRRSGRSIATSNHYLRAIKMFLHWMVKDRRTGSDPLAHLSSMNADTDRRRVRRALTPHEFDQLLESARTGPPILGISGQDRVILYIVACYTGFRRNEIGSVVRRSFDLDSNPPTLTVQAGYSKRRHEDIIPLRRDFAELIRTWLQAKEPVAPDSRLFQITRRRTSQLLRKDLARAGIPYQDEHGRYADFHALRKTFITNLSRAGVSPKAAQTLARHSDINLTMNTYTMLAVYDQAQAVESLPPIPAMAGQQQEPHVLAATGTDGPQVGPEKVPTVVPSSPENGAILPTSHRLRMAPICTETAPTGEDNSDRKCCE